MEEVILSQEKVPKLAGIACDSRKVKTGYAFVAIDGFKTDGNNYINEAIKNGASIVFTEKALQSEDKYIDNIPIVKVNNARKHLAYLAANYYNYPSEFLNIIGVTGTNGKTTTTHLIYHLLNYSNINTAKNSQKSGKIAGLIGTVNIDTGKHKIPGNLTTPDSIELQKYLSDMFNEGLKYVCIEVSSHGIKLNRITGTNFTVKVGTNISADHFDLHPDFDDYIRVKREFLEDKTNTLVLINQDNKYLRSFGHIAKKQINFSLNTISDVFAENIKKWKRGHSFTYKLNRHLSNNKQTIKPCSIPIKTNLPGYHNIYNALIAITIALYFNIPIDIIQRFFQDFQGIWRRLEFIYDENFTVIDDCAHNPGSYEAVFNSIKNMNYNKLIIINSLRGNRGTIINKKNAETISRNLSQLKNYKLITSNCNDVVKKIDQVSPEEEEIFFETLSENDITSEHYQLLKPALVQAVKLVANNDIILLLGPHAMDNAGEMILEII